VALIGESAHQGHFGQGKGGPRKQVNGLLQPTPARKLSGGPVEMTSERSREVDRMDPNASRDVGNRQILVVTIMQQFQSGTQPRGRVLRLEPAS